MASFRGGEVESSLEMAIKVVGKSLGFSTKNYKICQELQNIYRHETRARIY